MGTRMKHFGRKRAVFWLETPKMSTSYSYPEAVAAIVYHIFAFGLILATGLSMVTDFWPGIVPDGRGVLLLAAELLLCGVVYDLILGRFRFPVRLAFTFPGCLAVSYVAVRFYRADPLPLEDGFLEIGTQFLEVFNRYYKTNLLLEVGRQDCVPLSLTFFLLLLVFVLWNLSFLVKTKKIWLIFPFSVWMLELCIGIAPSWKSQVLFCLSFWMVLQEIGQIGKIGRSVDASETLRRRRKRSDLLQSAVSLLLLLLIILLTSVVGNRPAEMLMAKSPTVKEYQGKFEKELVQRAKSLVSPGAMMGSDNVNNKSPEYAHTEVLTITADNPVMSNLYLKQFHGAYYFNGNWNKEDAVFLAACEEQGLEPEKIQRLLSDRAGCLKLDAKERVTYLIDYRPGLERGLLAPYFVRTEGVSGRDISGDFLLKKNMFAGKSIVTGLNTNDLRGRFEEWSLALSDSREEKELWEWYDSFVRERYLDVPDTVPMVGQMAAQIGSLSEGGDFLPDNQERLVLADKVCRELSSFSYSLELNEELDGMDAVAYFLTESRKGYCVHFASAGTLILRKLGVPARYATGYVVKRDRFVREGSEYLATVLDSDRHAWVEIYLDRLGWIPIEMTPGYETLGDGTEPGSQDLTLSDLEDREQETKPEPEPESMTEPETEPESMAEPEPETNPENPTKTQTEAENGAQTGAENESQTEAENGSQTGAENESRIGRENGAQAGAENESRTGRENGAQTEAENGMIGKIRVILKRTITAVVLGSGLVLTIISVIGLSKVCIGAYHGILQYEYEKKRYRRLVRKINLRLYKRLLRRGKLLMVHPRDAEYEEALKKNFKRISGEDWDEYMRIVKKVAFSGERIVEKEATFCFNIYKKLSMEKGSVGKDSYGKEFPWKKKDSQVRK